MFHFNRDERLFILFVCAVLFMGTVIHYAFNVFPGLNGSVHLAEDHRFYPKTNINSADEMSLMKIPYIGEYTAKRILAYRAARGKFHSLEELKNIDGIRSKNFDRFAPYLTVK